MEYQQVREQVLSGSFRGRGYDPFFRGRGSFRGFPANRGFGMFPPWRAPAPMFHFFQGRFYAMVMVLLTFSELSSVCQVTN